MITRNINVAHMTLMELFELKRFQRLGVVKFDGEGSEVFKRHMDRRMQIVEHLERSLQQSPDQAA